jgi:peptidoglycan hydrolase FlgJ
MLGSNSAADVYTDLNGLAKLRSQVKENSPKALKEAARQFESVFIQMALKSMRKATQESNLMNSNQTKMYRDMYDQQMALALSKDSHLGLTDMLVKQFGGTSETEVKKTPMDLEDYRTAAVPTVSIEFARAHEAVERLLGGGAGSVHSQGILGPRNKETESGSFDNSEDFVQKLWPEAQQAADELGVDPKMLLAQAALESGWGKAVIQSADGGNSHNLFGIKADRSWGGRSVATQTTEFEGGQAVKTRAAFRAYDSYADSFRDYVGFLKANPRYNQAINSASNPERYISGLQKAGYATDPNYARKVLSIYRSNAALDGIDQV